MKSKYYLRGFGTGVLFATIILMIAFMFHDNKASNQKHKVNSSGNAIYNTTEESGGNPADKDTSSSDKVSDTGQGNEAESTTEPQSIIETESTAEPESTAPQESTAETESIAASENVTTQNHSSQESRQPEETTSPAVEGDVVMLTITSGMISNEAAALLEEYGVVESGYDFNMYLYHNGYESKLRVGTYEIRKGASYEEIAKIITRKS